MFNGAFGKNNSFQQLDLRKITYINSKTSELFINDILALKQKVHNWYNKIRTVSLLVIKAKGTFLKAVSTYI